MHTNEDQDTIVRPLWHGRVALVLALLSVACFVGMRLGFASGSTAATAVEAGDTNIVLLATFGMGFSLIFSTCAVILAIVSFTHGKVRISAVLAMLLALGSSMIAILFTMGT